jgi:hypothetical protein
MTSGLDLADEGVDDGEADTSLNSACRTSNSSFGSSPNALRFGKLAEARLLRRDCWEEVRDKVRVWEKRFETEVDRSLPMLEEPAR